MNQEIIYKTLKTYNEENKLNKFRPHANYCKKCANKKDAVNKLKRNMKFYANHKEKLQEKHLLNYYKRIYNDRNFSTFEVSLLRIAV